MFWLSLVHDLRGDLEAFLALGDTTLGVVAGEVEDLDQFGFDEFGVLALEFTGGLFECFVDGSAGSGGLLGSGHSLFSFWSVSILGGGFSSFWKT